MAKIAFLGLGQMGERMASRLIQAGHTLTVWNRTPHPASKLRDQGAEVASSPEQAVSDADFAITMLADPNALEEVVFGNRGAAQGLRAGQVLIDMSTVGPAAIKSIAGRLADGVVLVDAPVKGSLPQVDAGQLEVFVGANDQDFRLVQPILEIFGPVRHTGGPGSGAATKLVVNLALGAAITALGEALSLGESLSLPRSSLLDILSDTPIGGIVKIKRRNIELNNYEPNFKLRLAIKDLRLAIETGAMYGRDLRMTRAAMDWMEQAAERGASDLDFSAVVAKILEDDFAS